MENTKIISEALALAHKNESRIEEVEDIIRNRRSDYVCSLSANTFLEALAVESTNAGTVNWSFADGVKIVTTDELVVLPKSLHVGCRLVFTDTRYAPVTLIRKEGSVFRFSTTGGKPVSRTSQLENDADFATKEEARGIAEQSFGTMNTYMMTKVSAMQQSVSNSTNAMQTQVNNKLSSLDARFNQGMAQLSSIAGSAAHNYAISISDQSGNEMNCIAYIDESTMIAGRLDQLLAERSNIPRVRIILPYEYVLKDVNKANRPACELNVGDTIWIADEGYPDFFVISNTKEEGIILFRQETRTVELGAYYNKTEIDEKLEGALDGKLHNHCINVGTSGIRHCTFNVLTHKEEAFSSLVDFCKYFRDLQPTQSYIRLLANGFFILDNVTYAIESVFISTSDLTINVNTTKESAYLTFNSYALIWSDVIYKI